MFPQLLMAVVRDNLFDRRSAIFVFILCSQGAVYFSSGLSEDSDRRVI